MFVLIVTESSINHTVNCLIKDTLSDKQYQIVYNAEIEADNLNLFYRHLTLSALRLQEILLFETESMFDAVTTPVLVIFDNTADITKMLSKQVNTDTIFFNSLHNQIKPTAIYGSIVSITKVLRSADKIQHLLKNNSGRVIKPPFNDTCHELFQLVWYSQKIGLKVYETQ